MFFFFATLVIALACSIITSRTLVGYIDVRFKHKVAIVATIVAGWFSFFIVRFLHFINLKPVFLLTLVENILYFLLGFLFILFVILIFRDFLWYAIYGITKLTKKDEWHISPSNISLLVKANIVALAFTTLISVYAFYQACKVPDVEKLVFYSDKIKSNMRIAMISDLHINRTSTVSRINKIVDRINEHHPDIVVMVGDIIDDAPTQITKHLDALKNLKTNYGVYVVMGNHEFYSNVYAAKRMFDSLGFIFLYNDGLYIEDSNIYLMGLPDLNTMHERINFWQMLKDSKGNDFKVLLSHAPTIAHSLSRGSANLILSGHTHGGQIFPFHLFALHSNSFLGGKYSVNGTDLYVSRGAGTWGPKMRLFAPSDITIIDLLKI